MIGTSMTIPQRIRNRIQRLAAEGGSDESMIALMKYEGLPKVHSIRLLSEVTHMRLGEAKIRVHSSPVWSDRQATDEQFHQAAFEALKKLGFAKTSLQEENTPKALKASA